LHELVVLYGNQSVPVLSLEVLGSTIEAMVQRPNEQPTAIGFSDLWTTYATLERRQKNDEYNYRLQSQRVLLLNMAAWEWLESTSSQAVHDKHHWLFKLGQRVHDIALLSTSSILSRDQYLPNMAMDVGTATYTFKPQRYPKPSTTSSVYDILACWLGFPDVRKYRSRAWFTRVVVTHLGVSALLLDVVWTAAGNISRDVFGGRKNLKGLTEADLIDWGKDVLASSPACRDGTEENRLLSLINTKLNQALQPSPHVNIPSSALSSSRRLRARAPRRDSDNDSESAEYRPENGSRKRKRVTGW
jgi:hypothetical protein